MESFRKKETTRQRDCAKGVDSEVKRLRGRWGVSEARIPRDNATVRRGWMESFRKKETM